MMFLKKILAKFKSIKNIEIYVALVLALVVILIVFVGAGTKNKSQSSANDTYISQMEHKICSVIENIAGCGKASVAISYSSNEEYVYAYETVTTTSNGVTKQTSSIVSVKGEPLVVKTLPPTILGVVVVAEGADNPVVKLKIVEVVVTLLNVQQKDVQVFTYKS
ncbi:MAG: hypothetical protein J1G02_03580 [Clostridiales bacterium]|nr:hypothetical protein [Clostridiales bacterium]